MTLNLFGLKEIPLVKKGDNIANLIIEDLKKENITLQDGDIILIAETLISKAEGNYIKLDELEISDEAKDIAKKAKKDPKLIQAVLNESNEIVVVGPNFIVTETKHGFVCANAGIDESNAADGLATPMPENPDKSAKEIRESLEKETNKELAVIITDTQGRAFRVGAIGTAIGCSGIKPLWVRIGDEDLYGRALETTEVATADELSAAASLLMGQANEGIPVVLIRGFSAFETLRDTESGIKSLIREKEFDAFRK
ncbi:MAG: coenzyme F420-0:L-glutamate ligase [archaeon]|nr:coenzyme F420-0:L-glutamate ligase [archaeon]